MTGAGYGGGGKAFERMEEETEDGEGVEVEEHEQQVVSTDDEQSGADKEFKPVFLKGLFR
jgi:hypothetical protein